ncbi:MAG: glycosyltransferase [Nitrospiria bacterium]
MNILTMSNTFTPHVGGVARSLERFRTEFRRMGHRDLIVAPTFDNMPEAEVDVVRLPAIQQFNGSDFSVRLPIPALLFPRLEKFKPDVVHAHHPFLLGDTALRIAALHQIPHVFTHHTLYEQYTHYVPGDSPAMKRFVIELSTGYANLCDGIIAPSESIAALLEKRGVCVPITVIPTGIGKEWFVEQDGAAYRAAIGIPKAAFVIGHVGRLAPEKNLGFMCEAVLHFMYGHARAHFLLAGSGPLEETICTRFKQAGLSDRLHRIGQVGPNMLVKAYRAMDVFVFASQSETQGMVLTEAMAAGVPVVAVDASGVREVVEDGTNGRLLPKQKQDGFSQALSWIFGLSRDRRRALQSAARETADRFSITHTAERVLKHYERLIDQERIKKEIEGSHWLSLLPLLETEWDLWTNRASAITAALSDDGMEEA